MALCNAVDRTFLSNPEADADWWLGMVAENESKEGVWRSIWADEQLVGSISVERKAREERNIGELGYMILTPWWSKGIGAEAVRQISGVAFEELKLGRISATVFEGNLASERVLEKNGFRLEKMVSEGVLKGGKMMNVRVYQKSATDD